MLDSVTLEHCEMWIVTGLRLFMVTGKTRPASGTHGWILSASGSAHTFANCYLHRGRRVYNAIVNWDKDTNGWMGTELIVHSELIAVGPLQ